MKKTAYLALLLCMVLLLTGCTSDTVRITKGTSDVPLPEVDLAYEAPVGDAALSFTRETTVYVPSHDGVSLNSISLDVGFSLVKHDAESIVRAMLAFTGSGMADSLGNGVKLSLYGSHPVEVSRNTVTINLGASALRLNRNRLYLVGQAFAETLTQLPDVKYVNLLITGKPVGMDTANTLPMGAFATASVKDINGVYEQLLAHRVSADETAAEKPFVANVTLYYPLEGLDALVCDTRSISFDNQTIGYMVSQILTQLALGLEEEGVAAPQLPLLGDLMTSVPAVVASEDAGGDILLLSFAQNFDDMLTAYSVSRETEMASLCRTFCTFLPNLVGIRVDVNGTPVDELLLVENQEGDLPGELYLRRESQVQLDNFCTLWFADEDGSLVKVERPVNYYDCSNPRQKLLELAKGPQPHDSIKGVAVMQENAITDTMMIGMALQDSTLLVNFSPAFVNVGNDMDAAKEQLLAYAIVNTLCENDMVSNVCIFRSGKQFEGFSGNIYWNGLFYPIPE